MIRNGAAYFETYKFHGRLPYALPANNDLIYLDDCIKALEAARAYDSSHTIDLFATYELILQGTQNNLPRKIYHQYVLNITNPKKPKLKLVHDKLADKPYYTWQDVLTERTRRSLKEESINKSNKEHSHKRGRRWGNRDTFDVKYAHENLKNAPRLHS